MRELTAQVGISECSNCKTWHEHDKFVARFKTMLPHQSRTGVRLVRAPQPPRQIHAPRQQVHARQSGYQQRRQLVAQQGLHLPPLVFYKFQ